MIRTAIAVIVLILATFFLPFWVQVVFYVLAIFFVRYHIVLILPALFSDSWYAPARDFTFHNNKTFLVVVSLLLVYFLIIKTTRIKERYGLSKT